ncbi:hypothetical protein BGZ98_000044 [Dissophora globulifera]|nr:hypothetical protein BGZ98_000044 [Dissophora globulifera]
MYSDDEEAAIAEAIRLSMAESTPRTRPTLAQRPAPQIIDLTDDLEPVKEENEKIVSAVVDTDNNINDDGRGERRNDDDEDDEDLKAALALSLKETSSSSSQSSAKRETGPSHIPGQDVSTPISFDGLSRAEMERQRQERLRRLAEPAGIVDATVGGGDRTKRQRTSLSPSSDEQAAKSRKAESSTFSASISKTKSPNTPAATASTLSTPTTSRPSRPLDQAATSAIYQPEFPSATFRNTSIRDQGGEWEIRFQDLIRKEHILKAAMTSFELDETWLERYLPRSVPQLLVEHWHKENGQPGFCVEGKVTILHPPLNGFGTFHPKLMLLFYPMFCRVVVSSANLVQHDWEELVNTVYVQDFSMLSAAVESPAELGDFGSTLHNYLQVMTVPDQVLSLVRSIDFRTAKVLLIPSVQGSFPVAAPHIYGIAQLAKALRPKIAHDQEVKIEYQTSSLGKLTLRFLTEFHRASTGLPLRARSRFTEDEVMPDIKVIFPTERHVQNSRLGELGAGTVCFQDQYWKDSTYPQRVMHDFECVGALRSSLMHSKLVLAEVVNSSNSSGRSKSAPGRTAGGQQAATKCAGWFYIGSANFTESAWGSIASKRPTAKQEGGLYISMRNWELGIVYVVETEEEMNTLAQLARSRGTDRESDV